MVKTAEAAKATAEAGSKKRKGSSSHVGMIDYGPDSHKFEAEVKTMMARYSGLSAWLCYLLDEKGRQIG